MYDFLGRNKTKKYKRNTRYNKAIPRRNKKRGRGMTKAKK